MNDTRIKLRAPWLAGLLTYLVPGLGQLFQGRTFKGLVYLVCISGLLFAGLWMSDGKAIQAPPPDKGAPNRMLMILKFSAQCGIGTPSLLALLQSKRYQSEENVQPQTLDKPLVQTMRGVLTEHSGNGIVEKRVNGTVTLNPKRGPLGETIDGTFQGQTETGEKLDLKLDDNVSLAPPIQGDKWRSVSANVDNRALLTGFIERPTKNWLFVPMDEDEEQELHGRLGKWHELAVVMTWIAGLLNVLAIWDAISGPAYGYNDDLFPRPDDAGPKPVA